eukprot:CAMPEP_0206428290 /NCGR_PEP_ID=MMETSP0324_2-20121206/5565_1 /ASSEMBLY_ACC=CAM_ASM_000836 /TAXON_ID=2866 /ORGANISM="Crypthecodinium cohnii, Strain Seligo" /LENGTH=300 /DNA_ID=CAMNT_0053893767 /DNA_START=169 /DNA_END=1071 /DNA_ORIENTATION=-
MRIRFEECESLLEEDCNIIWQSFFTFDPETLLDIWTPVILGLSGAVMHLPSLRHFSLLEWFLPHNYTHYSFFMVVAAFCGNIGYVGKLGIILGCATLLGAFLCLLTYFLGQNIVVLAGSTCGSQKSVLMHRKSLPTVIGNHQPQPAPAPSGSRPSSLLPVASPPRSSNWRSSSVGRPVSWLQPYGLQGVVQWDKRIHDRNPGRWASALPVGHHLETYQEVPPSPDAIVVTACLDGSMSCRVGMLHHWDSAQQVWCVRLCSVQALNEYLSKGTGPDFLPSFTKVKRENLCLFNLNAYRTAV